MIPHQKSGQAGVEVPGISVRLLGEEEFSQYREPWNELLETSASESFFLKWEWLYTFWETIDKENTRLLVWLCHDGDELVGIAPLYIYASTFMKIPLRKAAFLGDRVASDYMDFFAKPGYEEICCHGVMQRMQGQDAPACDLLELNGVCADSNLYRHLTAGGQQAKDVVILPGFECPRARLGASFEGYTAGLSASTRYALGRKQRRLEGDFDSIAVEHLDLAQHPELLDVLFRLHKDRWEIQKDKASSFCTAFRKSFNERLLHRLGEGEGFFSRVLVDEKPVSILYVFAYKKHAFFYQNGWDPGFASYSIGIYNIQQAIQHAIEGGYRSFDFLRGEEAYKYKFCDEVRQAYSIRLFGKGLTGRLSRTLLLLKVRLRNRLRSAAKIRKTLIKTSKVYSSALQERLG
jgi:CelD/BcsL family acetyltransferase involved in cellulose biosynthesis